MNSSHDTGRGPLQAAETRIAELLEARDVAIYHALLDRAPLPEWPDTSDAAVARKVLGLLLDTGWAPPPGVTIATTTADPDPRHPTNGDQ